MTSTASVEAALGSLKTYYLISGIANAIAMVVGSIAIVIGGIATCGLGCVLLFLPLINTGVMIFDFVASSKVTQAPSRSTYSFLRTASILDIVACFAVIPLIMGILSLQILGKPEVRRHFEIGSEGLSFEPPQL
jgi:hypothetical protein